MSCNDCLNIVERLDLPHVVRKCKTCGRVMHILDPGENGKGLKIEVGDRVVIPEGFIRLSMNPLSSTGRLYKPGIDFLARELFLSSFYNDDASFEDDLSRLEKETDRILAEFPPLSGLDINNSDHGTKISEIMKSHDQTREFWAYWTGQFLAMSRSAIEEGDFRKSAKAIARAERCRAMMVFKEGIEDAVWMGQSVKRILELLAIWKANQGNDAESFWQETFSEHSYSISQVFAVPVVFIQNKAYVGGAKLDGSESRFVDYLLSVESSGESILVEIKTPVTRLLGSKYRDFPSPSQEISGSIVQVLNYRDELITNLKTLIGDREINLSAISPRCVLIAGNAQEQLKDSKSRRSFELFRANQKDVEIITFDELFRKTEILAELFGLSRKQ